MGPCSCGLEIELLRRLSRWFGAARSVRRGRPSGTVDFAQQRQQSELSRSWTLLTTADSTESARVMKADRKPNITAKIFFKRHKGLFCQWMHLHYAEEIAAAMTRNSSLWTQ
eukprot:759213-Hanusia_phi.AAC.3